LNPGPPSSQTRVLTNSATTSALLSEEELKLKLNLFDLRRQEGANPPLLTT
jgi:hypothetical protein